MKNSSYTPYALSKQYSHQDLLRQFIVCKRLSLLPKECKQTAWKQESIGSFWIGAHPDLPITNVVSQSGTMKACFLGYVIDPFACTYNKPTLPESTTHSPSPDSFNSVEAYLDTLSGRFICIVSDNQSTRIYLDASGSLPMMYSPQQEIAASSLMLIPYTDEIDDHRDLIQQLNLHKNNGIYPFGLTSRKQIKRLLPNHYLNLDTWIATRHWPLPNTASNTPFECFTTNDEASLLAAKIGKVMENTITTILNQDFTPYMSLTAGVDSRTLLACAYSKKEAINFFTWELPDSMARLDIEVATKISTKHHLRYQVFPYESASASDVGKWLYRTSLTIGEVRGQDLTSTVSNMDSTQPYFAGNVSEVSRGVFWHVDDNKLKSLTGEEITQRLKAPLHPDIINAAEQWLAGLPNGLSIKETLDFLYLEQRVGCWASEIVQGHAAGPFHLYPFSNRKIFTWMLSSPNDFNYRKNKGIIKEVIKQLQPELLEWEFNGDHTRN